MLQIYFAPLQGYTEDCYRRIHHTLCGGVDSYYTPFVRLEHGKVRSKDMRDVKPEFNAGVPVVPQVIAANADELSTLISVLRPMNYTRIDINMGCPFPLQTNHGRGSGLLVRPEEVKSICNVIKSNDDLHFSVKMRIGLAKENEWTAILPMLNDTPLVHIAVHPRVASQGYKGDVNVDAFESFADECRHPLIYNGDILCAEDIDEIAQRWPNLHGVMIGRGLLARPTLAEEYKKGVSLADRDVIQRLKDMHTQLLDDYIRIIPAESQQLMKIRTFWDYAEPLIGRKLWKKIHKAGNMRNYLLTVAEL